MEESFTGVALRYDNPMRRSLRCDPFLYHHQVPGGPISNLRSQLRDMDMEDYLDAVLEEAGQVRGDLGVSPSAQLIITQAVINVRAEGALRVHPGRSRALRVRLLRRATRLGLAWCSRPGRRDREEPRDGDRSPGCAGPAVDREAEEGTRAIRVQRRPAAARVLPALPDQTADAGAGPSGNNPGSAVDGEHLGREGSGGNSALGPTRIDQHPAKRTGRQRISLARCLSRLVTESIVVDLIRANHAVLPHKLNMSAANTEFADDCAYWSQRARIGTQIQHSVLLWCLQPSHAIGCANFQPSFFKI